jgi:hypothetical protein
MAKLFLFAIGGSGSRVVKSLAMLLASGVKIENTETIVPIIIDPDSSNGDLTRTVEILKTYKAIREKAHSDESTFFGTKFSSLDELGEGGFVSDNFKFDIEGVSDQQFKDFIGYSELDPNNKSLTSLLFSKSNLDADMDMGFKGNPNIGSIVLNKFKQSDFFRRFAQNFEQNDRVFIISSIFGGTGASGFPLILKNIRDAHHPLPHHSFLNDAQIGAVTILPYFGIKGNDKTTINSDTFISKTKAALHYYSRNVTGNKSINALYYIGDILTNEQEGADGSNGQKNRAHFVELASAMAAIDFMSLSDAELNVFNGKATNPLYFEFGLKRESTNIQFSDLATITYDLIAKPLTQYAVFRSFIDNHYASLSNAKGEAWASNGNNKLDSGGLDSRQRESLRIFNGHFKDWLTEMKNSNVAFDGLDVDKQGSELYQLIVGAPEKKSLLSSIFKGSGLNNFRNKLSELEPKFDFLPSPKKFLALMSHATSEVFDEKINH